jgi:hypothetical protein
MNKMINKPRKPIRSSHRTTVVLHDGKLVNGKDKIENVLMVFPLNDGRFVHKLLIQFFSPNHELEDITIDMKDVCCIY